MAIPFNEMQDQSFYDYVAQHHHGLAPQQATPRQLEVRTPLKKPALSPDAAMKLRDLDGIKRAVMAGMQRDLEVQAADKARAAAALRRSHPSAPLLRVAPLPGERR